MSEHNEIPELTDAQKARWQATVSDVKEMSAGLRGGTMTQQDMQGALNRLLSCDIDRDTLINAVHIPLDAGPYAPALQRILRRIPDGWGRWISHDAGWYPIVVTLDERLATIDPDYVVHQVKEKFDTLRAMRRHSRLRAEASRDPLTCPDLIAWFSASCVDVRRASRRPAASQLG